MSVSIIKCYFNCIYTPAIVHDQGLPELFSSLSNFVPPKAIELANTEVEKVKDKGPRGTSSTPYLIFNPIQRFQVGKRAAEHGITAWLHVTNLSRGVNVHYVLRNMFSKIFSLGEFHNLPNFLLPMCSCNEFAKFSCCQSFPPYGTSNTVIYSLQF